MLADVVRHPSFPAEEVERQRASRLASLVQQRENAGQVANTAMAAALYGPAHPYGFTELGTAQSNKAIAGDDMRSFWAQNFVPNNAALIVSGQISAADLRSLAEQAFGDWARGTPARPSLAPPATTSARVVVVDKPGAPQTQVRVASVGVSRGTPPGAARLYVRGAIAVRVPALCRSLHRVVGCPDRCHRTGRRRDLQGSAPHP